MIRKVLQEDRNKETPFLSLYDHLMFISINQKNCIESTKLHGFTREITIFDEFSYIMHSEKQITSIDLVPPENRICTLTQQVNSFEYRVRTNTSHQ